MSITEVLDELYEELEEEGIEVTDFGIYDEEDLQVFALNYLMLHLKEAFEDVDNAEELEVA